MSIEGQRERAVRRQRILGRAGQVAGIVGIAVCLALLVGTVLGRGWATGKVDDITGRIDTQIARLPPIVDRASTGAAQASDILGEVETRARAVADDPNPGPGLLDPLRERLATLSQRYLALREQYAATREQVLSIIEKLQLLDTAIPAISIPPGPIDALNAMDARLQELDDAIVPIINRDPADPLGAAATTVAERAALARAKVGTLETTLAELDARLDTAHEDLGAASDSVNRLITLGTVGAVVLLAWLAFVHWALFQYGSRIRREATAA